MESEFHYDDQQGRLFCEQVGLTELQELISGVEDRPFVVYSKAQIVKNAHGYLNGWKDGIKFKIGYALKANFNPAILRIFRDMGLGCIAVSGNEVKLALREGIPADSIVLNGTGKQRWEVKLALENGCYLNIDSVFDAKATSELAGELGLTARVFLRVNSESGVSSDVHSYNLTTGSNSKFGVGLPHLEEALEIIAASSSLQLVGLHCHLGSTIEDVSVLIKNFKFLTKLGNKLRAEGHLQLRVLNLGGGLGIDYLKSGAVPVPNDLIDAINQEPEFESWEYILEPGRSLIGNAAMIVGRILGKKKSMAVNKRFLVTNVGMNDLIRPCLYGAHHHISLLDKASTKEHSENSASGQKFTFDVVGPICESGDFLAKDYEMVEPVDGAGFAVWDVGAYGACMGSNYNMRPKLAEILVDGNTWSFIKRAETFEDVLRTYDELRGPAVETAL